MKVWTNNKFRGFYPVGSAAVVVAETKEIATALLNRHLSDKGLPDAKEEDMEELWINAPHARILCDGDY